jgi:hypothetical protein
MGIKTIRITPAGIKTIRATLNRVAFLVSPYPYQFIGHPGALVVLPGQGIHGIAGGIGEQGSSERPLHLDTSPIAG